jgi:hypothetical protein
MAEVDHIFVDYENVRNVDLSIFGIPGATVTLLLGMQDQKLSVDLVEKLIANAATVDLVRLDAPGRNAVDFALAYYLGRKVAADPRGAFHLVSKDKGYDPLVEHLRGKKIRVQRHEDLAAVIAMLKPSGGTGTKPKAAAVLARPRSADSGVKKVAPPEPDPVAEALTFLRSNKDRPKRRKTLVNHLQAHFRTSHSATEIESLLKQLENGKHLTVAENGVVTYSLDQITDLHA